MNSDGLLTHQHERRRCSSGQDSTARAPTRACSTGVGSRSTCSRVDLSSSVDQDSWSPNSICGRGPSRWVVPTQQPAASSSIVRTKPSSGATPSILSAMLPPRSACTVISGAASSIQQARFVFEAASATPSNGYCRDTPGFEISRTCLPSGIRTRTSSSPNAVRSPSSSTRDPDGWYPSRYDDSLIADEEARRRAKIQKGGCAGERDRNSILDAIAPAL